MRNDGTKNTGQITTSEGHSGLGCLAVVTLLARQTVIDHLYNGFKGRKLHHCVGDLTTPERVEALVQTSPALLALDGVDTVKGACVRVGHTALHADLDSLKGTKGKIGQELGGGRGSKVEAGTVLDGSLGADGIGVGLFEVLVPPILEGSLGRISKECGAPASEDAADALCAVYLTPGLEIARVQLGVDLTAGLDEIKWRDGGVGETLFIYRCQLHGLQRRVSIVSRVIGMTYTCQQTAKGTGGIVSPGVELNLVRLGGRLASYFEHLVFGILSHREGTEQFRASLIRRRAEGHGAVDRVLEVIPPGPEVRHDGQVGYKVTIVGYARLRPRSELSMATRYVVGGFSRWS